MNDYSGAADRTFNRSMWCVRASISIVCAVCVCGQPTSGFMMEEQKVVIVSTLTHTANEKPDGENFNMRKSIFFSFRISILLIYTIVFACRNAEIRSTNERFQSRNQYNVVGCSRHACELIVCTAYAYLVWLSACSLLIYRVHCVAIYLYANSKWNNCFVVWSICCMEQNIENNENDEYTIRQTDNVVFSNRHWNPLLRKPRREWRAARKRGK